LILLCLYVTSLIVATPLPSIERFTLSPRALSQTSSIDVPEGSDRTSLAPDQKGAPGPLLDITIVIIFSAVFVASLTTCFMGYFQFRFLLASQTFIVCHFFMEFMLWKAGVFHVGQPGHYWGVFFGALFLTANAVLVCNVFIRLNYILVGFAFANALVFLLQPQLGSFNGTLAPIVYILLFLGPTALVGYASYRYLKLAIPLVSAIVGAVFGLRCLNILFQAGQSFPWGVTESWFVDASFLGALVLAASAGFWFQLRMKGITEQLIRDGDLEEINRRSYLA
jgi:hypothetical protein